MAFFLLVGVIEERKGVRLGLIEMRPKAGERRKSLRLCNLHIPSFEMVDLTGVGLFAIRGIFFGMWKISDGIGGVIDSVLSCILQCFIS